MMGFDVYTVKKGDSLKGGFMVEEMSGVAIMLKDADTGEEGRIQLPGPR